MLKDVAREQDKAPYDYPCANRQEPVTGSGQGRPLCLIIGERSESPCDHDTFQRFQLWVAKTLTDGVIETYFDDGANIVHYDRTAALRFPNLLNPCECGTYLPLENIQPGPMLASAFDLRDELRELQTAGIPIEAEFLPLVTALGEMADLCLQTQTPLEIR